MLHLYTLCYRQGVARPKGTSSLVRGRVNATHRYVPTVNNIHIVSSYTIVRPHISIVAKDESCVYYDCPHVRRGRTGIALPCD